MSVFEDEAETRLKADLVEAGWQTQYQRGAAECYGSVREKYKLNTEVSKQFVRALSIHLVLLIIRSCTLAAADLTVDLCHLVRHSFTYFLSCSFLSLAASKKEVNCH